MATLTALQTDLKLKLNDANSRILTSAQQINLINEGLEKWSSETEEIWQENAYALVANQFYYAAPTNLLRVVSARYAPTSYSELEVVNAHEFERAGGYDLRGGTGTPSKLIVEGQNGAYQFRIWPPPPSTSATNTLNGAITAATVTISLASANAFRTRGWVSIESEKLLYQNSNSTALLIAKRAMGGTTAASHANATTVTELDLFVTYVRRPATLAAGGTPEIDGRWHYDLTYYALWQALALDGKITEAREAERIWTGKVMRAKREIARSRGAAPSFILEGGY